MKKFVRSVCDLVEAKETFVMVSVVESSGSTPRSSGAKMVVRGDGSIFGTVGGGLAEAHACRDSLKLMESGDGTAQVSYVDMTQELAAESDMICGGGLTVLMEVVEPDGPCAAAYVDLDGLLRKGTRAALCTRFEKSDQLRAVSHEIRIEFMQGETPTFEKTETELKLVEPFIPAPSLYIFGAGHVSQFTARVAAMIGFRTVVLDDRADFANAERFPEADEVVVLSSFKGCCEALDVRKDSFVIIVTRGHLHDKTVLAEALGTVAGYIGMIGSRRKRDSIYAVLLEEGFSQKDIDRCSCPIGLPIGAQTPEEIAVSICAELIQVRSGEGT
ncbi:XdhC family aldehyde oxidoreductase maturation factor [Pseudodesulfovibrio piezophilus]|uniref:XshC-Cox1-family protein n=1 Tax=Pseudodesulfovibrio piezophilus (strain DSM 21447 / JCM 15486 / C1TLV30) TaxID=1322246 RepID=M1WSU2_PSEP2|nr:XdhC/CoxI family protein [Pseudodesulfovibrio piezophilus]CCH49107.1 conserved protein of unknown function [Pseudodesulfovibrio piezophilus C1TLV30]